MSSCAKEIKSGGVASSAKSAIIIIINQRMCKNI